MKLILTAEVDHLGSAGDTVEVKDGYGRNYLVPRGLAILATRGAEKQVAQIRRAREVREVRDLGHAKEVKETLEGLKVSLEVRAGSGGRLFGSVTPAEVAQAVKSGGGPDLDKRRIELPGHIKSVGQYQVQVRLHTDVTAKFTLNVAAAK